MPFEPDIEKSRSRLNAVADYLYKHGSHNEPRSITAIAVGDELGIHQPLANEIFIRFVKLGIIERKRRIRLVDGEPNGTFMQVKLLVDRETAGRLIEQSLAEDPVLSRRSQPYGKRRRSLDKQRALDWLVEVQAYLRREDEIKARIAELAALAEQAGKPFNSEAMTASFHFDADYDARMEGAALLIPLLNTKYLESH